MVNQNFNIGCRPSYLMFTFEMHFYSESIVSLVSSYILFQIDVLYFPKITNQIVLVRTLNKLGSAISFIKKLNLHIFSSICHISISQINWTLIIFRSTIFSRRPSSLVLISPTIHIFTFRIINHVYW